MNPVNLDTGSSLVYDEKLKRYVDVNESKKGTEKSEEPSLPPTTSSVGPASSSDSMPPPVAPSSGNNPPPAVFGGGRGRGRGKGKRSRNQYVSPFQTSANSSAPGVQPPQSMPPSQVFTPMMPMVPSQESASTDQEPMQPEESNQRVIDPSAKVSAFTPVLAGNKSTVTSLKSESQPAAMLQPNLQPQNAAEQVPMVPSFQSENNMMQPNQPGMLQPSQPGLMQPNMGQ